MQRDVIRQLLEKKPQLKHKDRGFPGGSVGEESACQCRRLRFNPWSGKIPHAAERLNPWATNTEPVSQSPGAAATEARVPESLCSSTREATTTREQPWLATIREKHMQQQRPSAAKNKKIINLKSNKDLNWILEEVILGENFSAMILGEHLFFFF